MTLMSSMLRIGLTGGIASGKSTVCRMLQDRGCTIVDADKVAHDLLLKGQPCFSRVLEAFGVEILDSAGEIDRNRLGAIVFENRPLLQRLEGIVHPEVIRQILAKLDILEKEQPHGKVVVDASLMIESGFYKSFKRLVVVTCRLEQQLERLITRNGLSEIQARRRISIQMPLEQKLGFADYVIDNSRLLEHTRAQVDALLAEWSPNP
ncbi:MAG: dephospho-CoA kinase [Acidobacteria bacterium]|nr:MAG: dephospho-CoA kinase [Acidobacteriota bacterium]